MNLGEPLVKLAERPDYYPYPLPIGWKIPSRIPDVKVHREGKRFEVLTWQQKMFDETYCEFETVRRPPAVLVIPLDDAGRLTLTETEQLSKPLYHGFVAGDINLGEDKNLPQGINRELLEELGYTAQKLHVVYFHEFMPGHGIEWYAYTVIATGCKKVKEPLRDRGERCSPYLVDFDLLVTMTQQKKFRYPPRIITDFMISNELGRVRQVFKNPANYSALTYTND